MADTATSNATPKKATSAANGGARSTPKKAKDVAGDAGDKAEDQTNEVPADEDDVEDAAEDAQDEVDQDAPGEAGGDAEGMVDGVAEDAQDGAGETAGDAPDAEETAADAAGEAPDAAKGAEAPEGAEDAAPQGDGDDVVPAGKVNEEGQVVDDDGNVIGQVSGEDAKDLDGKVVDQEGDVVDDEGNVIGKAEPTDAGETIDPESIVGPLAVNESGEVADKDGKVVGKLVDGDAKELSKKKDIMSVDKDGNLLTKDGKTVGKIELSPAEGGDEEDPDLSLLEGKKVNKAGNVVDENGNVFGRLIKGDAKKLIGRACDAEGKIWNDSGKVIGEAELIPEDERKENTLQPFEDYPDATIDKEGNVIFDGQIVGKLVEGDPKKLQGKKVDPDGDVVDRNGNTLGRAERYDEPEPEPEAEVDRSELAGKKVNKAGNVVDERGSLYGKLIEGDPKKLAGFRCDKYGNVWNDSGEVVGKAELLPPSERDAQKEGPFSDFPGSTVTKDGKVVDAKGEVIGRLIQGDGKQLAGKTVDDDGDVIDKNGNPIGKAERWEEPEKEKVHNPLAGRKVNREGNVVDENGDLIGKLTEGKLEKCIGKEIDEDGDINDQKGQTIGHVTLLDDLPPEEEVEPALSPEEQEKQKKEAEDKELAKKLSSLIAQAIERMKPVLDNIDEHLAKAERTPKDELDEEKLVNDVKPLIEEGGRILSETNGTIRALDPDGRIQANAKHKAATNEASPEEYRLAEQVKELTENVHKSIEKAKKRIADMPHAKKKLNPLWALLSEPLGQIIAAVGLLLSGVLGLVGKLLGGLGLGGLLDNLLGGLGLNQILDSVGVGGLLGGGKK